MMAKNIFKYLPFRGAEQKSIRKEMARDVGYKQILNLTTL